MKRQKNSSTDESAKKKLKKSNSFSTAGDAKSKLKSKDKKKKNFKFEKPTSKVKNDISNKRKSPSFHKKKKPNMDVPKSIKKEQCNGLPAGEKPNWLEYKKQQKELRDKRRAKKLEDSYDVAIKAKQIGEKLRRRNLSLEAKEKLTKNLYDLIQNLYVKLVFTHDISRVIQWQLKYCNSDIELAVVEELRPHIQSMFFSKYAKNILRTILKKGSDKVKKIIVKECYGHVVKLLSSVISAPLFEKIYAEIASPSEKNDFKQELYGDIYKKSKDPDIKVLSDTFKHAENMKIATLSAVKINLTKILNKNLINSSVVHTVLYEYLSNCNKEDRAEIIAMVRPLIAEMTQTKDGAKAANLCIWHGTNKDRKLIMKGLKEHIKSIITSEHGHLIILGLLDSIDDTVLLKKIVLQELLNNLNEIVVNEYGKRVIFYLVARRDTHYFHPKLIAYLKEGDGNVSSKKPAEIREKELLDGVIDHLLENVNSNLKIWLAKGTIQLLTLAILKASRGDKPKSAFEAIAKFITDTDNKLENETQTFDVIEEPGLHLMLKKLIQMDMERSKLGELTFGEVLLEHLNGKVIEHWINYNRGCFLLLTLLKCEPQKLAVELKSRLKKIPDIKLKKGCGVSILLKKLDLENLDFL